MGMLALTGRLMQLQLLEGGRYQNLSAANQYNFRIITPPRGRIVDRAFDAGESLRTRVGEAARQVAPGEQCRHARHDAQVE